MRKTSLFVAFLATILAGTGAQAVQAAGTCDLTDLATELVAIQTNTSMGEVEQLKLEIVARRKLLNAAIDCDQAEIAARVKMLGDLPDKIKILPAYSDILESLAKASGYYENQKAPFRVMGVWDIKTTSRTIAVWRQETYLPTITWADNLIIWANNQQFMERASERLDQIGRLAFSLKLVNQNKIEELFEKAKASFDTATAENDRAREALNQERPALALAHIQASLKALADTYQVFFDLQESLRK